MDKYMMIDEMRKKLDLAADAKGALRCGLIWDISCTLDALRKALKAEDETYARKIETLKAQNQAMEGGAKE